MERESCRPRPDALLGLATRLLSIGDFLNARAQAQHAQQLYPTCQEFARIIAVADVLLAAGNCLPNNEVDWFSMLKLNAHSRPRPDVIRARLAKLLALLNPDESYLPFAREAFRVVLAGRSTLLVQENDTHCDKRPKGENFDAEREEKDRNLDAFWTVCPYCFYMYEYERVYKDCCLRCQNCKRGFHGMEVEAPPAGTVVEGKEEYYCGFGYFPLRYRVEGKKKESDGSGAGGDDFLDGKKGDNSGSTSDLKRNSNDVFVISSDDDDSDDEESGRKVKEEVKIGKRDEMGSQARDGEGTGIAVEGGPKPVMQENGGSGVKIGGGRLKSVARRCKKLTGRGKKIDRAVLKGNVEWEGPIDRNMESAKEAGGNGAEIRSAEFSS